MIALYASRTRSAHQLLEDLAGGLEIQRDALGKPFFPARPQLHFNLSHSGGLALVGLGDEPVGVDIEVARPRRPDLPRYALTEREYARFLETGDFYALWTRREAWVKWTGRGVARSRGEDIPPELELRSFCGEGWRAAACARGEIGPLGWV